MKKRLLAILLTAIMVVSLLPTMAFAEGSKPDDATWLGDSNVWYKLTESESDTLLTIGGEGAMPDYSNGSDRLWNGKANSITSVEIEDGVTVIGKRAFLNFANVKELTVPASVKKVSAYAFKNSGLETITFAGIKAPTFTDYALAGTTLLTKIRVPLKKIDAYIEAVGEDLAGIVNGYVNVTLNANGGTGDEQLLVVEGNSYTLPKNDFTAPADKHFAGWARKAHGQVITGASITLTDDITLYAIWQNNASLSGAASILDAAKDFEYDDGGQYNGDFNIMGTTIVYYAPKNLPDPTDKDEVSNYKKLITNDFGAFFGTLYRFDNGASVESISYDGDEYKWNPTGTLRGSNWQKDGSGVTLISQLGNEIQAETGSANITFMLNDDNVNLIAQTGPHTVTFKQPKHGKIEVMADGSAIEFGANVPMGTKVTVKATPNFGYRLDSLKYNDGENHNITISKRFIMPDKDVTITADFDLIVIPIIDPTPGQTDKQQFESYKTLQKIECDKLITTTDSEAVKALVTDAKTAIDNTKFDSKKSLNENKAVVDSIVVQLKSDIDQVRADEATTALVKSSKVNLVKSTAYKNGKIKLTFKNLKLDNGVKVVNYQVYRSTSKKFNKSLKKYSIKRTADTKNYTWTNAKKLKKGTKYYYRVRGKVQLSDGTYVYTKWSNVKNTKRKTTR